MLLSLSSNGKILFNAKNDIGAKIFFFMISSVLIFYFLLF